MERLVLGRVLYLGPPFAVRMSVPAPSCTAGKNARVCLPLSYTPSALPPPFLPPILPLSPPLPPFPPSHYGRQQRRERREKLEALQKRKKDEEEQARREVAEAAEAAAAAAAAPAFPATNGASDAIDNEALHPGDRQSPPSPSSNGGPAIENATSMLSNPVINSGDDCEEDDDAGPIEITKQAAGSEDGSNGAQEEEEDGKYDESGARNGAPIPGEGRGNGKAANGSGGVGAGAGGGLSSSELRAQQGKEDRPVFDMFSAASPSAASGGAGPGGKMGGKGGGHGMSYLGDDGGGDQVSVRGVNHVAAVCASVKTHVLRLGIVGMRGSMVIRLLPCMP